MTDDNKKPKEFTTQIGIHSVRNLLGNQQQISLFSDHDKKFSEQYGVKLEGKIDRFGIDLTDTESRLMEGMLRSFTETGYKGNIAPKDKLELADERFSGKLPKSYKYVKEIPRIRITQDKILGLAGINKNSIAEKERAVDALMKLGTKQYCFYYDRLAFDSNGIPEKDNKGNWKKEEVSAVDTLFNVKVVRDEKSSVLKYYEVTPSSIFLDQRESYFMLIPFNWREEVKHLVGKKRASSYTFRFLLFLRYQYEMKRRSKHYSQPYKIKWSSEEIAIAIKMPESVYRRKKKRANQILEDAYSVAKTLGYLSDYQRTDTVDILILRDDKYYTPGDSVMNQAIQVMSDAGSTPSTSVNYLFQLFYQERKKLDPASELPRGPEKKHELSQLGLLIKKRPAEDVEKLIHWGMHRQYWCTRLSTISKLVKHFSEAWIEMEAGKKQIKSLVISENKSLAKEVEKYSVSIKSSVTVHALNKYIEFSSGNYSEVIKYDVKNFRQELHHILCKRKINFDVEAQRLN